MTEPPNYAVTTLLSVEGWEDPIIRELAEEGLEERLLDAGCDRCEDEASWQRITQFTEHGPVEVMTGVMRGWLPALIDPDCRDGKHRSCFGGPCECDCHVQPADYDAGVS